jgi:hypothetical protein
LSMARLTRRAAAHRIANDACLFLAQMGREMPWHDSRSIEDKFQLPGSSWCVLGATAIALGIAFAVALATVVPGS